MGIDEYRDMMDKVVIPDDMDQNLKRVLIVDQKEKHRMKRYKVIKKVVAAAACAALLLGVSQTEFVSKAAVTIADYFQYGFSFTKDDGEKTSVDMKMAYITLDEHAPTEEMNLDSIDQVSDIIGIRLLNTEMENQQEGYVNYSPMVSEDHKLYGVQVSNKVYSFGDLKNIGIDEEHGGIAYDAGEEYQTPVGVQIAIRTDENLTEKYENNELGFVDEKEIVDLDDKASDAEIYEISNLGVKAVLFTVRTDGPMLWGIEDGEIDCTHAIFVYEGVEYLYYGGMTHDTMKAFLETLNQS